MQIMKLLKIEYKDILAKKIDCRRLLRKINKTEKVVEAIVILQKKKHQLLVGSLKEMAIQTTQQSDLMEDEIRKL